jgi:hypothetical protein
MKKIEFFSSIEGVAGAFPIRPAQEVIPKWVYAAKTDYMKSDKKDIHIYKCPGIFDMFTTGYIISNWIDVEIKTNEVGFNVTIPDPTLQDLLGKDIIQSQVHDGLAKHIPKKPWSVKSILKLNTPWHVITPKNVKLLILPLPYPDTFEFESAIGVLDPSISTEINIQGYWNLQNQSHTIKAGTPLAQIIPMTEQQLELVVRDKNKHDELWLQKRKYLTYFSFIFNRLKTKEAYNGHFA